MDSLTNLIILRFLHIVCGVFWAGAAIYLAAFVLPAVKALGPDGGKFMQQLAKTNKLPVVMTLAATTNIVAGILLLWKLSGGFQYEWMVSRHGLVLNAGVLLGIIAYLEGLLVTRPTILKINELGAKLASGVPPSQEQLQLMQTYRQRVVSANNIAAFLLAFTVISMSLVRYL